MPFSSMKMTKNHQHQSNSVHRLKPAALNVATLSGERDNLDEDQSPPMSPLRLPQLSSSSSSISSWSSSSQASQSGSEDGCELGGSSQCNSSSSSKEERASYNTKFARYHLETYRQNDRMRWNFDFDHNRPLEESHHHHHQTVARYQWEPAI